MTYTIAEQAADRAARGDYTLRDALVLMDRADAIAKRQGGKHRFLCGFFVEGRLRFVAFEFNGIAHFEDVAGNSVAAEHVMGFEFTEIDVESVIHDARVREKRRMRRETDAEVEFRQRAYACA